MTATTSKAPTLFLLQNAPAVLFAGALVAFGLLSPRFLTVENLINIMIQSSSVVIVAVELMPGRSAL